MWTQGNDIKNAWMKRKQEEKTFYSLLPGERRTKQDCMNLIMGIFTGSAIQLWEWLNFNRAQLDQTRRVVNFLVV